MLKTIQANNFSPVQYAQALALNWRVQLSPDKYVYEVMLTNNCIHAAGQDTCGECKVVKVRSRAFVRKSRLLGQQAIPNIIGGAS